MLLEDVDTLSYNELRALAKSFNLKPNRKAVILRADIKRVLSSKRLDSPSVLEPTLQPVLSDNEKQSAVSRVDLVKTPRISSTISPASSGDKHINLPIWPNENTSDGVAVSSPIRSEKSRRPCSANHDLNVTYELDEPIFCIQTESTNEVGPSSKEISQNPSPIRAFSETNPVKRTPVANHSTKAVSKCHVRPVPDFHRIHSKAASKLESIAHYFKRRHENRTDTRPPFASPTYRSEAQKSSSHPGPVQFPNRLIRPAEAVSHVGRTGNNLGRSVTVCVPTNRDSLNKSGSHIPLDSAFARRKAYDSQRAELRRSATCKAISVNSVTAQTPPPSRPSKDSHITVRRRDLLTRSVSLYSNAQKQRAKDMHQQLRLNAKSTLIDSRRGLS